MTGEDGAAPSVEEFVEYCRIRAGLLRGRVETMAAEADDLLDELDERTAEVRSRLEHEEPGGARTPQSANRPADDPIDVDAIEEMESEIERKQLLVETKHTRMEAFRALADGYDDLASELGSCVDDGRDAMERLLAFEAERDAPAYFEEPTLLEAAASDEPE